MRLTYLDKTTIPLAADATYQGALVRAENCNYITGTIKTDQSCTAYICFSSDGENIDYISNAFDVTGGTGAGIILRRIAPFVALRIVNGSSPQSYLRAYIHGSD